RRRAVEHAVGRLVARTELEAAPVAKGEQERFVDLADRTGNARGRAAECRVPALELDGDADRGTVIQLRLADEMDFTFLDELETLVLNGGSVGSVDALDVACDREELVVAA